MGVQVSRNEGSGSSQCGGRARTVRVKSDSGISMQRVSFKLLLLGPGEAGKSTILKQMRIIHQHGFTNEEYTNHAETIKITVIQAVIAIAEQMVTDLTKFDKYALNEDLRFLRSAGFAATVEFMVRIKQIWQDTSLQNYYIARGPQLDDGVNYFLQHVDRILKVSYKPTQDDLLRLRIPTLGINEINFPFKGKHFRVIDIAGQKSQRKKWLHCFSDVHGVIFLAALTDYCSTLREDEKENRMQDTLQLFEYIVNNEVFVNSAVILFLNKKDLFESQLAKFPLNSFFAEYKGANTYMEALLYVKHQFLETCHTLTKRIYIHETCATDTGQMKMILDDATEAVVTSNLQLSGLY